MTRVDLKFLLAELEREFPGEEEVLPRVDMEELLVLQQLNEVGIYLPTFGKVRPEIIREHIAKIETLDFSGEEFDKIHRYLANRMDVSGVR